MGAICMKTKRALRFKVSPELLQQALKMPDNCRIYGAEWSFAYNGVLELYVESEDFPEVKSGEHILEVTPTITSNVERLASDNGIEVKEVSRTWDWNLPK